MTYSKKSLLSDSAIILLVVLVLALAVEMFARLAYTFRIGSPHNVAAAGRSEWFVRDAHLGWRPRPNFDGGDICGVRRKFDAAGILAVDSAQLRKGTRERYTVLFLGDSNTYGFCLDTSQTFVEVADQLLPDHGLVNLGVNGYSSFQGYKTLLEYGPAIKPEVVVISFNYNDRRQAFDATPDGERVFEPAGGTSWLQRMLSYSYSARMFQVLGERLSPAAPGTKTDLASAVPRVDLASYRSNLIKMVEWCRKNRAEPVFMLLGDNPGDTKLLRSGLKNLADKQYAAAIADLSLAADRPRSPGKNIARLQLAEAYSRIGQDKEAKQVLAGDPSFGSLGDGGLPVRVDVDYNRTMIEVAKEYAVRLVDLKSKLEERPWVFFDFAHFDAEGHQVVAALIKNVLDEIRPDRSEARTVK